MSSRGYSFSIFQVIYQITQATFSRRSRQWHSPIFHVLGNVMHSFSLNRVKKRKEKKEEQEAFATQRHSHLFKIDILQSTFLHRSLSYNFVSFHVHTFYKRRSEKEMLLSNLTLEFIWL